MLFRSVSQSRYSQWEKHLAYSYNVDYWDGKSSVEISADMIKLRYANYPKDYFLGVLPNSQYGSVAFLQSLDKSLATNAILARSTDDIVNSPVRMLLAVILYKRLYLTLLSLIDYFMSILTFPHFQFVQLNISNVGKR